MVDMRHGALECARAGLRVHPLYMVDDDLKCSCRLGADCPEKSRGKHPRLPAWQTAATAAVDRIEHWWGQWPDAGIGIATGPASKVWVLDCDGDDAIAWYRDQCRAQGLVRTVGVKTGRGRHFWFEWPGGDGVNIRNAQGIVPGVDVRGDGGYVIGPPTRHRNGARYELLTAAPYDVAPRQAPAWLIELVREKVKVKVPRIIDIPRRTAWSMKAADEELARRLRLDPIARETLGQQLGGVIAGAHARKVPCPRCSEPSVWWMINGTGYANCSHLKTCGWLGPLTSLLG